MVKITMFNILLGLVNLLLFVTLMYLIYLHININKELDRYHEEVNETIEKLSKRIDFLYENLDPNIEIAYQTKTRYEDIEIIDLEDDANESN